MPPVRLTIAIAIAIGLCLAWPASARRARKGRLLVQTSVVGATIEVDGQIIGESPMRLPFVVRAGRHEVRVTRPGHAPFEATVKVRRGRDKTVRASLPAVAAVLRVRASPDGARVSLDGRMLGLAPVDVEVPPGRALLEVLADGHSRHREPLMLSLGEVTAREVRLLPIPVAPPAQVTAATPWYRSGWVWAAAGAVVAGAVTTAIVLSADGDDPRPPPTHSLVFEPVR